MLDLNNISHNGIMTLTQGHIDKVKVTVNNRKKLFPAHCLSRVYWKGGGGLILHTIIVHGRGVVVARYLSHKDMSTSCRIMTPPPETGGHCITTPTRNKEYNLDPPLSYYPTCTVL